MKRLSDLIRELGPEPERFSASSGLEPLWPDKPVSAVRPSADAIEQAIFERGVAEGRRLAAVELERQQIDVDRLILEAVAGARLAEDEARADRLFSQLTDGLSALEERLGTLVLDVLEPILRTRHGEAMREAFEGAMLQLLAVEPATSVRISGPEALVAALSRRLESVGVRHESIVAADETIVAELDETRIAADLCGLDVLAKELLV